jgi:hypothetical protein
MKARLSVSVVCVLALALTLSVSARLGARLQPASANPKADRDDRDRDHKDRDNDACRNDEMFEHNRRTPLEVLGVIPIPGKPPLAFDINWADPVTERVYTADRTNAAIDIIDAEHNVFVGRVTGGVSQFAGLAPAGGGTTTTNDRGPNGVVTIPTGYLVVGDGNSTVQVASINPADPAYLTIVQSISTNLPACDDGTHHYCERADEVGFDPKDHLILILNDEPQDVNPPHAAITPYGNWVDVSSIPFKVVGTFPFPGAGGAEQPVWDPAIQRFLVTVPGNTMPFQQSTIAVVKPFASSVEKYYNLGDMTGVPTCTTAAGLALGSNQHAVASACGGVVIFNALTGKLITFDSTDVAPGDEVWANVGDGRFYVAGADKHITPIPPATTQPSALGVFDMQTGRWLQNVDAQGVRNPTAFAETNTVFGEVGGATPTVTSPYPNVCIRNGVTGTGCYVIFSHAGSDADKP